MSDDKSAARESGDKNNPILLDDEDDMRLGDPDDAKGIENKMAVAISKDECPYLDTIDRRALDFDFEKLCSVSLSKVNVYACLVCGKYFQGRGKSSHAFIHSVSVFHHVFLNIETLKFYCLPDNYELTHPSLQDILHVLRPVFTKEEINSLDKYDKPVTAYDGKSYYPGIMGLNNLKHNDYCSVIFQALSHVAHLRDYFLVRSSKSNATSNSKDYLLALRFGELLCKLWNPRALKPHVSPHEMLQTIVLTSKKRFEFTKQGDPIVFLGWFLNSLMGPKRTKDNIIKQTFQGKIRIASRLLLPITADKPDELIPAPGEDFATTSFLYLTLDLPTMPLFPKKDKNGKVIKPRVGIYDLLKKFDCKTQHEFRSFKESSIKRYEILQLPRYLILYYKRFSYNSFSVDKNTHIVDFTIKDLNMTHLVVPQQSDSIDESRRGDRKTIGNEGDSALDRHYCYRLVANIVHDGEPEAGKGTYRAQILHRGTGKWFEMQDLYVTEVLDNMLITLSEPYIQIWELKDS